MPSLIELRVLDGPNIYFPRPAIKLTLDVGDLLEAKPELLKGFARGLGIRTGAPGAPGSEQRMLFIARFVGATLRAIARRAGVTRLGIRARPSEGHLIVAYPWRRLGKAEALGRATAELLDGLPETGDAVEHAARAIAEAEPGDSPSVPRPSIPTIAVTGTNGKTSVTRLIAHIGRAAGETVGWSNTDGIYIDGALVEEGDWSGFGGSGRVLGEPGVTLAVLETARGGILLRGLGAQHNDVSVVTNIAIDHLGQHGIDTLDQLAEVKATIVKVTRSSGWTVLNADDPRVLAMRALTKARLFAFSLDHTSPGVRAALNDGGRAATVLDGEIALLEGSSDVVRVIALEDVPVTLSGLSRPYISNALAATAAADAIGLPLDSIREGLATFAPDAVLNPGRMNLFDLDGRIVIVDMAHNEDGVVSLTEVAAGLRRDGTLVWLIIGSAGDRPDEMIISMGELAARGADRVVAHQDEKYLRGRKPGEITELFARGAAVVGMDELDAYPGEVEALDAVLERSSRGDVCALMCHGARKAVFAYLEEKGARPIGAMEVKDLLRGAREFGS